MLESIIIYILCSNFIVNFFEYHMIHSLFFSLFLMVTGKTCSSSLVLFGWHQNHFTFPPEKQCNSKTTMQHHVTVMSCNTYKALLIHPMQSWWFSMAHIIFLWLSAILAHPTKSSA